MTTPAATPLSFIVGQRYRMTSVGDSNCHWEYNVSRRTAKTVWLRNDVGEVTQCRVSVWRDEEMCFPLGKYSMAPILGAAKTIDEPGSNRGATVKPAFQPIPCALRIVR